MRKPVEQKKFGLSSIARAWALAPLVAASAVHAQDATLKPVTISSGREQAPAFNAKSSTGSHLGLTVKETPASIEVLSKGVLEQRGARNFHEALRGATGISAGGNPGAPLNISSRGFVGGFNTFLYDGVRISVPTMSARPQDLFNLERVEVLKGPSSVLSGEGALGSTINFITKRPQRDDPHNEALISAGSFNALRVGAGTGGNLSETGAYRFDISRNQSRGYIDRTKSEITSFTGGLMFKLSPEVTADISLDYLTDNIGSYWGTPLVAAAFATEPTPVVTDAAGRVIDRRMTRTNFNVTDGRMDSDSTWGRARLTWMVNPQWRLRNELGYYTADRRWRNAESAVFTAPNLVRRGLVDIGHDHQVLTNRTDIAYDGQMGGLRNRFLAGIEHTRTDFSSARRFSDGSAATNAALQVTALDPVVGTYSDNPAFYTGAGNRTNVTADIPTWALFAENALSLTKDFTVVAGLRQDRIQLDRAIFDLNTNATTRFGRTYRPASVRWGAVYKLSPATTFYAQYSDAAAPVGTSNLLLLSAENSAFPLTRGKQAELGIKQSLMEDLDWTGAVYRAVQTNVLSRDAANPAVTVNNGRISSQGLEFSAAWRPTRQLTLSGNVAWVDAQFDTLREAGGASRIGNVPPLVPNQTANLWLDCRVPGTSVTVGAAANHVGRVFTDTANLVRINGYTTYDAYASYRFKSALMTLRVRNLTDKLYATWSGASAANQVILGAPRTVELTTKFDF